MVFYLDFGGKSDERVNRDGGFWHGKPTPTGEILQNAIKKSINNIVMIGGFIILFSVIISILERSKILEICGYAFNFILNILNISSKFSTPLLTGFIELTNGVKAISSIPMQNISVSVILASFLLGFGGLCILFQVFSIISKTDISIKPYFIGKLLQACFASLYTFLALKNLNFLNLDLIPTYTPNYVVKNYTYAQAGIYGHSNGNLLLIFAFCIILFCFFSLIFSGYKPKK